MRKLTIGQFSESFPPLMDGVGFVVKNYSSKNPTKPIRRYRCSTCGKTFSETYFSRRWHLHRSDIDEVDLFFEWCTGSSINELASRYKCSKHLIENRITRMKELANSKDIILEIETKDEANQLRV
jgi:hypothetical protein